MIDYKGLSRRVSSIFHRNFKLFNWLSKVSKSDYFLLVATRFNKFINTIEFLKESYLVALANYCNNSL